jgi:hypothetical protein
MEPSPARIGYVGLRAKTARAVVVTIAAGDGFPEVVTRGEMVLATPANPEMFRPYQTAVDLPWERATKAARKAERAIEATAASALKDLVTGLCDTGVAVAGVGIVGAPERDLAAIDNPQTRATTAEAVLFRRVLQAAAAANNLRCECYPERDLESLLAARLDLPVDAIKARVAQFGERMGQPWRADEKAAAIAAWLASAAPTT